MSAEHAERLRLIGNELRQKCKSKGVSEEFLAKHLDRVKFVRVAVVEDIKP